MKTLITGFLIFACWASLATWVYVCKIKGFCNETEAVAVTASIVIDDYPNDSTTATSVTKPEVKPVATETKPAAPEMMLIYFEFDKSSFAIDSLLSAFSDASKLYMNSQTESSLFIIGHADDTGSDEYNMDLGYRRAQSVKDYFERKGMVAPKITIVSKGEAEPADNNSTVEGRAKNRRASISVITN